MKNTIAISLGLGVIIITGMVLQVNLPFNNNQSNQPNLSVEDAISLAMHDRDVLLFVRQNQAFTETNYESGVWTVIFINIQNRNLYIKVEIDDKTQLIIDVVFSESIDQSKNNNINNNINFGDELTNQPGNYYSPTQEDYAINNKIPSNDAVMTQPRDSMVTDYYYENNQEEVKAAIDYLLTDNLVVDYIDNKTWEFYGYSYSGIINVWGYQVNNYENWVSAVLYYDDMGNDSWSFDIIEISASINFGNPTHTFEEVKIIAENTEQFSNFTSTFDNYTSSTVLKYIETNGTVSYIFNVRYSPEYYYETYNEGVEDTTSSDSEIDTSMPVYDYYTWIDVEISDETGGVIDVWGPDSALLSENEVLSLVYQNTEIITWMNEIGSTENYTYYDGYGNWWIYLYEIGDYYNYANIQLNDRSEEIIYVYTRLSVPASLGETAISDIISSSEDTVEFFSRVTNYDSYFYYDQYGNWYVSYYDQDNYYNYLWAIINDSDSSISELEVKLYIDPSLTEEQVINSLVSYGLNEFEEKYPDVIVSAYYNGYDTWYVYGFSLVLVEAWVWAQVEDTTSVVSNYNENHPKTLPTMNVDQVISTAQSNSEYISVKENTTENFEYFYFIDGTWYYYLQGTSDDNTYYWLSLAIDDVSGKITDIWSSSWKYDDNDENTTNITTADASNP